WCAGRRKRDAGFRKSSRRRAAVHWPPAQEWPTKLQPAAGSVQEQTEVARRRVVPWRPTDDPGNGPEGSDGSSELMVCPRAVPEALTVVPRGAGCDPPGF